MKEKARAFGKALPVFPHWKIGARQRKPPVIQLYLFGAVAGIVHRVNRHFLAVPGVILQGHGPLAVDKAVDTGVIHIHRLHAGHIIAGLYRQFVVI